MAEKKGGANPRKFSDEQLVAVWNDLATFTTREDICKHFGCSMHTLKKHTTRIRRDQPNVLISRHNVVQRTTRASAAGRKAAQPINEIHVVTCAQNNTPASPAFRTLQRYCHDRGAKLHVIPLSYKTATPRTEHLGRDSEDSVIWWDTKFDGYKMMPGSSIEIANGHGVIIANQIQMTAVNPVQGYESIGGDKWVFLGHPQVQMRTTATAAHKRPKLVYTSGAMTEKNYREGTAGAKGDFHHSIAATVIEVCGQDMHVRQLNADAKHCIYDIWGKWTPTKSLPLESVAGIVTGDEHEQFYSPFVKANTYSEEGMVHVLKAERVVRHDVLDFWSRNHHHDGDPIINFVKHHSGTNSVERELDNCVSHLDETSPFGKPWFKENAIVAANHPEALMKWLKRADVRSDPENALIYHKLWTVLYEAARMTAAGAETLDPFEWYVKQSAEHPHRFIGRDEEYLIAGIDCGQHGDVGANGARGSAKAFAKAANKMMIGHAHTSAIEKGVYQVGHGTDGMNYARGHSGWMNTNGVIYPNGKRTLVHILDGGWRGNQLKVA